jgi:outer membrane biosynthesis protein TonB
MRMSMKIFLAIICLSGFYGSGNGQSNDEKSVSGGIINGKAIYLPKPEYPQEAKDLCAKGKVEVKVLIDESGNVMKAEAVSGDELLRQVSIEAAKKAKFSQTPEIPVKVSGIVVYNFVSEKNCITGGIANKKAIYLPKPIFPKGCRCKGTMKVRVIIDMEGNVIHAKTFSGNLLLQTSAIQAARNAKFSPTLIDGPRILIIAYLKYNFYSNGRVHI